MLKNITSDNQISLFRIQKTLRRLIKAYNLLRTQLPRSGFVQHKYHIWHTRHRSVLNALSHLMAALAAYTIEPLKLSAVKLITKEPALLDAH